MFQFSLFSIIAQKQKHVSNVVNWQSARKINTKEKPGNKEENFDWGIYLNSQKHTILRKNYGE